MTEQNPQSGTSQNEPESAEQASEQLHWLSGINYQRDGLVSWRNHVAYVLREVLLEDVSDGLVKWIGEMERQTNAVILEHYDLDPDRFANFGFTQWLPYWQEHFRHWHDPVRTLLGNLCTSPAARQFADVLSGVDGEVLLDFLLTPCCFRAYINDALSVTRRKPPIPFPLNLCRQPGGRMIECLYRALYDRFTDIAPFATEPVPDVVRLQINHDRLFPLPAAETGELDFTTPTTTGDGTE